MFKSLVAIALAGSALTLGACKKAPETASENGGSGGGNAPSGETAKPESGGAAKEETPPPPPAPAGKKVAEQIVGYWAPDKASLTAMMEEEMAGQFGPADGPGAAIAEKVVGPLVEAMLEVFVFHISEDKGYVLTPDGYEEQGTYEVVSADEATGDFVVKTTDKETGETEENNGNVQGDTITLTQDGQSMKMNRISEADFEARKAKAGEMDMEAIMAPLMQEILGGLEGLGEGLLPPGGAPELPPGTELPPGVPVPE